MAKISKEEYEVLKGLDDKWKWIARDEDLSVYDDKPVKVHSVIPCWDISTENNEWQGINRSLFQFIRWEDEEPYNITELIEEYESEETEVKKNIEWAIKEIEGLETEPSQNYPHDEMIEKEIVLGILSQLDEPEITKEQVYEKIAETFPATAQEIELVLEKYYSSMLIEFSEELHESIMRAFDVEETSKTIEVLTGMTLEQIVEVARNGGITPRQELLVIPDYVAKWISDHCERFDLFPALKRLEDNALCWEDVYNWYRKNTRKFVNAYLTGRYEVDEESKVQGTDILFKVPDKPQTPPIPGIERVETEENKCDEEYDPVHRPQHYMQGHIETIDKIKLLLTPEEYLGYLKGNVIKYDRAPFKGNMEQDYDKQKVYYDWALEQTEESKDDTDNIHDR